MLHAVAAVVGYLLGSIPTGVLLGRFVGRDPRNAGSGNIGASNVTRTLGKKWGLVTLLVDAGKGALPAWLAWRYGDLTAGVLAGGLAVVGHCWPVWLRFAGGKGVATALGTMLVLEPGVGLVGAVAWMGLVVMTRIPTIGSITAGALFVVGTHVNDRPFELQVYTVLLFLVLLLRHRSNLRVLKGRYFSS